MATQQTMFQQVVISSLPALFSLITGFIIFYGEFRALSERLESIGSRSQEYNKTVTNSLLDHATEAAHGTVREDLARLDLRSQSLEHRVSTLENHAGHGERYTEEDAERDLDLVMRILGEIRTDIRDLTTRVRSIEQTLNVNEPKHSSDVRRFTATK